jgi:hypothetical protein
MTDTTTDTYNPDDIRRVYAAFAAEYRIVAEWTGLEDRASVDKTIGQVKPFIEKEYLKAIHLRLKKSNGAVREASIYRVSTSASAWSSDSPGDIYWDHEEGDYLHIVISYSKKWWDLPEDTRKAFKETHIPEWGTTNIDGDYDSMSTSQDRKYSSGAYGMERTRHSG